MMVWVNGQPLFYIFELLEVV